MPTLKDVAKLAGVSTSTASRVLTGAANVNEATKARVMEAIEKLGYQTNFVAKSLRQRRTGTLALLIPNIRNPFYSIVTKGVTAVAKQHGYTVILADCDDDLQHEVETINRLKNRWVDGFIIATTSEKNYDHLLALQDSKIPLVLLVRKIDREITSVVVDDYRGGYLGTEYLLQKGHRRIAFIGGDLNLSFNRNRYLGYLKALKDWGVEKDEEIIITRIIGHEGGYQAVNELLLLEKKFTAVLCTNDIKALGAMRAIYDAGLSVPRDISVMGFDNLDLSALSIPALTTVAQPAYEMGEEAAQRVIDLINNIKPPNLIKLMDVSVVERDTVTVPPVYL
ncbi:MAG: transcriptional regulator, LacI family [Peptococcaceae bacterium]|jgi:DNA-binding LacI/PurR family transcriptional regulator|nr:transcriptional regulator, LacI family [Peptococcaceae bacterium]